MPVRWIEPGESVGAERGAAVVCIAVYGAHEHFVPCLASVLAHTSAVVPILICDDASPDRRSEEHVARLGQGGGETRELLYLRIPENLGLPGAANQAFGSCADADVVLVNSDCVVAAGWLSGLRAAAYADDAVATATALTNHGTIVSVPERGVSLPGLPPGWELAQAASAIRSQSLRLYPRLLTAVGHCVYVRRSALELVGDFDLAFSPGYGEEVDFSLRCLHRGLRHVAADDVLVLHRGGASFSAGGPVSPIQAEHERLLLTRYPYYHDAVRADEQDHAGPLPRAIGAARRALTGLTVLIDPGPATEPTGALTHRRLRELVSALSDLDGLRVTVASTAGAGGRFDLVHRLTPFTDLGDLDRACRCGERLVLTVLDLAGYLNPAWFDSFAAWEGHRRLTRTALEAADHVVFPTEGVRDLALAEGLITPPRSSVLADGLHSAGAVSEAGIPGLGQAGRGSSVTAMMLMIGDDRPEANRPFALAILDQLRRRHDWDGVLVMAGSRTTAGASSTADEQALLADHPGLRAAVLELPEVSDSQLRGLLRRAELLVAPQVGPGLTPAARGAAWEAALAGVPCLFAPGGAPSSLVRAAARIVPWDPAASAAQALALMTDADARQGNIEALQTAARGLTWSASAERLLAIYQATCAARPRGARAGGAQPAADQPPGVAPAVSPDGLGLVGPGGALPPDLERPLLALATHPRLAAPVFGAIRSGYRVGLWLRRRVSRGRPL